MTRALRCSRSLLWRLSDDKEVYYLIYANSMNFMDFEGQKAVIKSRRAHVHSPRNPKDNPSHVAGYVLCAIYSTREHAVSSPSPEFRLFVTRGAPLNKELNAIQTSAMVCV